MDTSEKVQVIVLGRHAPILPSHFEIVEQKDIQFPNDPDETLKLFGDVMIQARELGAGILFQNCPAILMGVLYRHAFSDGQYYSETGMPPTIPPMFATVNANRAPEGEKPVFELDAVLDIRTNKIVWQKS